MKKTFKHFICLFVAILCFGQMWATDYTIYQATSSGVDCANATKTGISVTFNKMKGVSNSPVESVANTTYGIEAGLKAPRWGGSSSGNNITIVVAENYTATITAYVQTNTASRKISIKTTDATPASTDLVFVNCESTGTVYEVKATELEAGTYYIKADGDKIGLIKLVVSVTATGGSGGGEEPGDDPDPDTPIAGTIEDLVEIDGAFTFVPTAELTTNTLYEGKKIISLGGSGYKNNGVQIKTTRQLAFKVAAGAKIVVTFNENGERSMQIGTTSAENDLANSASSPVTAIRSTAGIVYISASSDLYLTKLEIQYPHTITYNLNGGTGTTPTQASKYAGETFTVHNGVTGVTAPAGKEFAKWKDQDNSDVAAGTTYTMPAKDVTLTAQWRNETVKYAVTYNLNGYTAGVAPTETNKAAGDVFAIKAAPSWTDHDFLGWKCSVDAETYQASDNYNMTAAATTFTAQWQAFFTITYKDGETVLGTEKVNTGSAPEGIAEPTKELKKFLGWTLVGGSDLVNLASLTENTVLVAKWGDFDGCAYLAVDLEATAALDVGDNVALKASSFGGSVKVAGMKENGSIAYNGYGLYLSGGGKDSLHVTIDHQLQEGSKITVALRCTGTGVRGLKLLTKAGAEVAALGWSSGVANAEGTFTYEVPENSALIGEKDFRLQRNNTVYLKYISVEECAPQDFTVTYKDGASTMGTEFVIENEHPTASGITTRKNGYVFDGWAETDGGSVVDLDDITITADKTLYAVYSERVCATSGSMFKFQMKTDLTSGNVFSSVPNSVAATTDNYLAALAGGEVTFAVTGNSNNRLLFYEEKAVGFANGDGGSITIYLDCPLAENDEIRFINYASSGNSITLSDGTNSTTLDGNKSETVQTWSVPAAWAGAYELTMVRNAGTAKLTYFEIYRRPVLTSVSLEDLNLKVGATGTPVMTLNLEGALVTSQVWAITASTATGTTINAETGEITAGEIAGQLTVQVTVNTDKVATCTVKVVPGFEAPKSVTGTTTWNWATLSVPTGDGPTITNPDTVLANYLSGEEWETLCGNVGGRPYRSNTYKAYQGKKLSFKATVPGVLVIYASSTNSDSKKVYVNGYEVGSVTSTTAYLDKIVVPAGDVVITSESMRIYSMTFDTDLSAYTLEDNVLGGYDRTVNAGNYGTICLPNSGVVSGASIFEIAYYDEAQTKIFFDEVVNGYMVAGRPYIFLPNEGKEEIVVYHTDQANAPLDDNNGDGFNGLFGFYDTSNPDAIQTLEVGEYFLYHNQYYVVDATAAGKVAVGNYRAYIKLNKVSGNPSTPAPGRRRVSMNVNGKQVATDVENVTNTNVPQKVLINGRMFIILGEKMYDVTGQIVK